MKKIILVISVLALMPLVLAQETGLEISINSPFNEQEFNTPDISVVAIMNQQGNISFQLDDNPLTESCLDCFILNASLTNLSDGEHTLSVFGETLNESVSDSVNFTISTLPDNNETGLEITILSPLDQQEFNISTIDITAEMNELGNMSYKLDENNYTLVCSDCSSFTTQLTDLLDGTYTLTVLGETTNESIITSNTFLINTSPPDGNETLPQPGNESNESEGGDAPRFSLGFQKLPKQFASGEISNEELTDILNNNLLNPGILNRLAKTGKLTQEHKDAIVETQFLPPGIFNKLLGLIGFARNDNLEEFVENADLTDGQLSTLIGNNEIPDRTSKKLINEQELGEESINSLIEKGDDKTLSLLTKKQTLSQKNIEKIIEKTKSGKLIEQLIENQVLDEENIDTIINTGDNEGSLFQNQKLTKKQKDELNIEDEKPNLSNNAVIIGKQEKKSKKTQQDDEEVKQNKKQNNIDSNTDKNNDKSKESNTEKRNSITSNTINGNSVKGPTSTGTSNKGNSGKSSSNGGGSGGNGNKGDKGKK